MIDHLIENKIKLEDDNDILALVRYFREASDRDIIISMRRLTTDPDQEFQRHYWNLFETDSRFVLFGMFIMDLANMAKVELERVIENCDGTWVGALHAVQKMIYICNEIGYSAETTIKPIIEAVTEMTLKSNLKASIPLALKLHPSNVPN